MRVLAVADHAGVFGQMTAALAGEPDVEIVRVTIPQRAVALLDESEFDVIVSDADTAPTGGFWLARELQARTTMGESAPPVVLLIARAQDKFLAKWSRAEAFILKPADPFDLAAVVRAVVQGEPVPALPGVGSAVGPLPADLQGVEEGATRTSSPLSAGT